ncbi:metal ABC transporter substrate-binding protein [Oceanithermus sp.]|uniref:metal ABC transporter substrate-binding protein n=1 Tax=Oceanithermus sp. TaxID=2268145 RepID=UPI0025D52598|nr:metal ABC transporter substrate-binding protein [Oceanithermus sp.]
MKRLAALLVLLFAVVLAAEKPLAVATIEPYASLARAVLGEGWRVESLVPAGANPHVFNPTPADVKKVAAAKLVIMNGLGLDEWMVDELVRPNNLSAKVYRVEDSVHDLVLPLPSGAPDPHVWTDPVAMTFAVCDLARAAGEVDPDHADDYLARARAYKLQLFDLVQRTTEQLAQAPTRRFVAYKNPFTYLAARYDLERVYLIASNPSAEPTPRELAEAAKVLQAQGLRYLVAPLQTAGEARRVAQMLGAEAVFIDLLDETNPDYLRVWDANGRALARALGLEE